MGSLSLSRPSSYPIGRSVVLLLFYINGLNLSKRGLLGNLLRVLQNRHMLLLGIWCLTLRLCFCQDYSRLCIMKVSGVWVMFFVLWIALMFFSLSRCKTGFKAHDMTHHGDGSIVIAISRKLKETSYKPNTKANKRGSSTVNLEDYHPIDPVPSSKASVKPGPIEHGAPIIPYIPKPSPPDHPKRTGGSG